MRRKRIFGLILYDNILHNIILFICSTLFAISMCEVLYETKDTRSLKKMMMNSSLDNILYMVKEGDIESDESAFKNFGEAVSSLNNVELIAETIPVFAYDYENGQMLNIDLWGRGLSENQSLDLVEGHMPTSVNQIVLSEDYLGIYRINQTLQLELESAEDDVSYSDNVISSKVTVEVVGFYSNDSLVPGVSVNTYLASASELFTVQCQQFAYADSLVDDNGAEIVFSKDESRMYYPCILKFSGDKMPAEVKDEIVSKLDKFSIQVYTMDELRTNSIKSFKTVSLRYVMKMLAAIAVLVITFFAFFYLAVLKRSKEMTVYYLFGMSWPHILTLNIAALLPGILLGDVFGFVLNYREQKELYLMNFYPVYLLITIIFSLVMIMIFLLPLFINFKRNNPIENLARNNND